MENVIIIAILAVIAGLATLYIIRAKKSGKKCIGCPVVECNSKKGGCTENCACCAHKIQK